MAAKSPKTSKKTKPQQQPTTKKVKLGTVGSNANPNHLWYFIRKKLTENILN